MRRSPGLFVLVALVALAGLPVLRAVASAFAPGAPAGRSAFAPGAPAGRSAFALSAPAGRSAFPPGASDQGQEGPLPPEPKVVSGPPDPRFADIEWRFVRVKYHYHQAGHRFSFSDFGEPWYIDAPAAEQNLTRRMRALTSIRVADPVIVPIDDPDLFLYPWIYMVETGQNLNLTDKDAAMLREYLLRGGTLTTDDSHGPYEWQNLETQMKKVFPDRPIVELKPPHPVFTSFYQLDKYPQVPGLGSFLAGRTWEKGGVEPHLRTILDDNGRPMVFINFNTDMGDGVEWSNSTEYPGYVKHSADAYRMYINEIMYALTH